MNALFTTAMALRPLDSDPGNPACRVFEGELNEHWTIGPKVHGGAMVALCANAARTAYGAAGQQPMRQPVAVSASFLWAPDPGTMRLVTSIRKRGRRIRVSRSIFSPALMGAAGPVEPRRCCRRIRWWS